jgi:hypothetical protein
MHEHDAGHPSVSALSGERQLPEGLLLSFTVERASATARVALRRGAQTLIELEATTLGRNAPEQIGALRLQADLQGRPGGSGRLDATVQCADGRVFKARLAAWSASVAARDIETSAAVPDHLAWPADLETHPAPTREALPEPPAASAPFQGSEPGPPAGHVLDAASGELATPPPAPEVPPSPPTRPRGRRASTGTGREEA